MPLTSTDLCKGAKRANKLLKQARLDASKSPQISCLGIFLNDRHGGKASCATQAKTAAKHISFLEIHKPDIIAMEFFPIDQTTFSPKSIFLDYLNLKNEDSEPITIDVFLADIINGYRLSETTNMTNHLHGHFRMEGDEFDTDMIARSLLWYGHLNSVFERTKLVGLDIPDYHLLDELQRLCGTNPIWAETLVFRLSQIDCPRGESIKWAMIAGAEHWEWSKGICRCDLKDMLPMRLSAYELSTAIQTI